MVSRFACGMSQQTKSTFPSIRLAISATLRAKRSSFAMTSFEGSVIFDGRDITALNEKARRPLRRRMQLIFQDPMSSLNPRHTIGRILTEPLVLHGFAKSRAAALGLVHGVLDRVGLSR